MNSGAENLLHTLVFGPSAYTAHVELYSGSRRINAFAATPSVAMFAVDRHLASKPEKYPLHKRAQLWMDVNESFGPIALPPALKDTVLQQLKSSELLEDDRLTPQYISAMAQAYGLPLPSDYVMNVASFGALGLALDVSGVTWGLGTICGVGTFYATKILGNISAPENFYDPNSEDYSLKIRKN